MLNGRLDIIIRGDRVSGKTTYAQHIIKIAKLLGDRYAIINERIDPKYIPDKIRDCRVIIWDGVDPKI